MYSYYLRYNTINWWRKTNRLSHALASLYEKQNNGSAPDNNTHGLCMSEACSLVYLLLLFLSGCRALSAFVLSSKMCFIHFHWWISWWISHKGCCWKIENNTLSTSSVNKDITYQISWIFTWLQCVYAQTNLFLHIFMVIWSNVKPAIKTYGLSDWLCIHV